MSRRADARLRRYAEKRYAGRYSRLEIRFRSQFCYIDAYTEPAEPGPNWPPANWPETREEYMERLRNTPIHRTPKSRTDHDMTEQHVSVLEEFRRTNLPTHLSASCRLQYRGSKCPA